MRAGVVAARGERRFRRAIFSRAGRHPSCRGPRRVARRADDRRNRCTCCPAARCHSPPRRTSPRPSRRGRAARRRRSSADLQSLSGTDRDHPRLDPGSLLELRQDVAEQAGRLGRGGRLDDDKGFLAARRAARPAGSRGGAGEPRRIVGCMTMPPVAFGSITGPAGPEEGLSFRRLPARRRTNGRGSVRGRGRGAERPSRGRGAGPGRGRGSPARFWCRRRRRGAIGCSIARVAAGSRSRWARRERELRAPGSAHAPARDAAARRRRARRAGLRASAAGRRARGLPAAALALAPDRRELHSAWPMFAGAERRSSTGRWKTMAWRCAHPFAGRPPHSTSPADGCSSPWSSRSSQALAGAVRAQDHRAQAGRERQVEAVDQAPAAGREDQPARLERQDRRLSGRPAAAASNGSARSSIGAPLRGRAHRHHGAVHDQRERHQDQAERERQREVALAVSSAMWWSSRGSRG